MKTIAALLSVFMCAALIGCTDGSMSAARSGALATARIRVNAKPKTGVAEPIARVAVYDAAPSQAPSAGGTFERVDYSNLPDVIVWLEPTTHSSQPTSPTDIEIKSLGQSDHIHPASIGQTIRFWNKSGRALTLYSVSDGNEFELSSIAPGASASYTPKNEGVIEVLYDPAQPPIAQLYVAPSPWVAHTRSKRTVTFSDIPPGEYNVVAWHPRLPSSTSSIALRAGQTTNSTITIGVNALSESSGR